MIGLLESIIGSVKIGSTPKIEQWCDENIYSVGNETAYEIDSNLRINSKPKTNKWLTQNITIKQNVNELQSYIRFGRIETAFFSRNLLKYMKQDQIPIYAKEFYFSGSVGKLEDLTFAVCTKFSVDSDDDKLKSIKNLCIHFEDEKQSAIDFGAADLHLDDIKEIHATNCYRLFLEKLPAKGELEKELKKLNKTKKGQLSEEAQDYLNDLFANMPGLRFVNLSNRSTIEHNPKNGFWYMF